MEVWGRLGGLAGGGLSEAFPSVSLPTALGSVGDLSRPWLGGDVGNEKNPP